MLKFITLVCVLAGLLTALMLESWLRSHIVRTGVSAKNYAVLKNRNKEFWSIQILPLLIMLVFVSAAIFAFAGHINAAVFIGGAAVCFLSVFTGASTAVSGSIASSSLAASGDIRGALRSSYRSAAVMGLSISAISLTGLGIFFFLLDSSRLLELAASFALGASAVTLCMGVSGTAFSEANALAVGDCDFTDYTGMFIGSGADHAETYILSVCAVALLAKVGVDTSGVMSTFTANSAARYPLIVMASGIVASGIGVMIYRGRAVRNPSAGITAGNYVSAVVITAASAYFALSVLESYVYAVCVASGIIAGLASGEFSRACSADGHLYRRILPDAKKAGTRQSMIYSLSAGMISAFIPAALSTAAMLISYKFANFYGIALAAAGINSMAGVNCAVRGFSINTVSASEIVSATDPEAESPNPADVLLTASVRSDAVGRTYSGIAAYMTLIAMFSAVSVVADSPAANLLSTPVFIGSAAGAVSVFVFTGLIIRSVRLTSRVLGNRLKDAEEPGNRISSLRGHIIVLVLSFTVPVAVCAAFGASGAVAFTCSASISGMCLIFMFNNSGRYYDRVATDTLAVVLKFMAAVILVCAPLFTGFKGIF